jgi:hypothetical protein
MARNLIIRENPPEVPTEPPEEPPHACMGGFVFLGFEDEDGEEVALLRAAVGVGYAIEPRVVGEAWRELDSET